MPAMVSAKRVLISASFILKTRKASRARPEKRSDAKSTNGNTVKETSASFQLRLTSTIEIPIRRNVSLNTKTITEVKSSFIFWTSLVARVTRRATGLRLKKGIARFWTCSKILRRRSCITC